MEETIREYLNSERREYIGEVLEVVLLTSGNSSNHDNYKIAGEKGNFVFRLARGGDLINQASIADEYTILKKVEPYNIAPKALEINIESPLGYYLIEGFLEGKPLSDATDLDEGVFENILKLIAKTSDIKINQDEFPFKFSYSKYTTHFAHADSKLNEISKIYPDKQKEIEEIRQLADKAKKILEEGENVLSQATIEFVYNDVHPGNVFLDNNREVKFIDWQKVSLGDPTFMIALFAKRFSHLWEVDKKTFKDKIVKEYSKLKNIDNLEKLLDLRILERTMADMIWVVREAAKKGEKFIELEDNKHYLEAKSLISGMKI